MLTHSNHSCHLVDYSPWPLIGSIGVMTMVTSLVKMFHQYSTMFFFFFFLDQHSGDDPYTCDALCWN